jgi:hypothetical protein
MMYLIALNREADAFSAIGWTAECGWRSADGRRGSTDKELPMLKDPVCGMMFDEKLAVAVPGLVVFRRRQSGSSVADCRSEDPVRGTGRQLGVPTND